MMILFFVTHLLCYHCLMCAEIPLTLNPNDVVDTKAGKLRIEKKLGSGSFGVVYMCYSLDLGKEVALKVEKPRDSPLVFKSPVPAHYMEIEHELTMLKLLEKDGKYPHVYGSDLSGTYKYIVMELAGKSLDSVRREYPGGVMPLAVVAEIAVQLISLIEAIHDLGIIIYDVHVGNVMIQKGIVRLIDPGMAYSIKVNGRHIGMRPSPLGPDQKNQVWTSVDDDANWIPSRKGETERVLYMLLRLLVGGLPWEGALRTSTQSGIEVKSKLSIEELCKVPAARFLIPAFKHVRSLAYDERPNYQLLKNIFQRQLNKTNSTTGSKKRKLSAAGLETSR